MSGVLCARTPASGGGFSLQLFYIPFWFTLGFVCLGAVAAFWKGDWRAQAIASSQVVGFVLGEYICRTWTCWGPTRAPIMAWRGTAADLVTLTICLACAYRADRYWVLWASAFAVLTVATDLTGALLPGVTPWAIGSAGIVWAYLLNATILIGVWSSARAKAAAI